MNEMNENECAIGTVWVLGKKNYMKINCSQQGGIDGLNEKMVYFYTCKQGGMHRIDEKNEGEGESELP
jgi:hypothetical protein